MNNRSRFASICQVALALAVALTPLTCNGFWQSTPIDFGRQIQPILSENCFYCHGQDQAERQADLRLDTQSELLSTIVPGTPDDSELFLRISSDDSDTLMPPPDSHRRLTSDQIDLIRNWILQGAPWNTHWALRPIEAKPDHQRRSVDQFIVSKLESVGFQLSPTANRETLIRRVSLDLTGLPPTIEEIDRFLADDSPDAYSRMVDRFLDSPAYGEKMAWAWLDAARYADTNGYQGDNERTMWPWRDWVINAFNDNLPFDEFSKWQLAGDLLPDATVSQRLASGFLRNHPINGEGGRIAEENRVDYVMDMTETTGTIWLAQTFNCCRCHDHKYDQLSQNDYYSLFAFFNQTPVNGASKSGQTAPVLSLPDSRQKKLLAELEDQINQTNSKIDTRRSQLTDLQNEWEEQYQRRLEGTARWSVFTPESVSTEVSQIKRLDDDSFLTFGPNPPNDNYTLTGTTALESIRAIRLEALPHPSMTRAGLARSNSSNFVLTGFRVEVISGEDQRRRIEISSASADYEQGNHRIANALDADSKTGWAVLQNGTKMDQPRRAIFHLSETIALRANEQLRIVLEHQSVHQHHNIGRFRISLSSDHLPSGEDVQSHLAILKLPPGKRTSEQSEIIAKQHESLDDKLRSLQSKQKSLQDRYSKLDKQVPKVMVMRDKAEFRKTYRLNRGSYQEPMDEVFPQVPSIFPGIEDNVPMNRLALANWLFDAQNPLTARVAVNRIWAQIFGMGLVKTIEDFGVQGEPPSHPELLDWLAVEFRRSKWDTKQLLRTILCSRTYRQSSKFNDRLHKLDPENRLLGRSPRYRMPSWMLRDCALAASGRLVKKIGGKPVNTYQPAGVWEEASFGKKKFKLDTGDSLYRRSIYTFWRRIASPTMFFDNSDRMTCSVKRYLTNTPLHALSTLNDTTFVEAARLLAVEVAKDSLSDQSRLELAFRRVLSRKPDARESEILLGGLKRSRNEFSANEEAAKKFLAIGESSTNDDVDSIELASWTSLCLAILNLDEALTRQ